MAQAKMKMAEIMERRAASASANHLKWLAES
jgi:hypothetical protein